MENEWKLCRLFFIVPEVREVHGVPYFNGDKEQENESRDTITGLAKKSNSWTSMLGTDVPHYRACAAKLNRTTPSVLHEH